MRKVAYVYFIGGRPVVALTELFQALSVDGRCTSQSVHCTSESVHCSLAPTAIIWAIA